MAVKQNNTARWVGAAVGIVLALLAVAAVWGEHQSTLGNHDRRLEKIETRIQADYREIKSELSETTASLARIEARLNGDHRTK